MPCTKILKFVYLFQYNDRRGKRPLRLTSRKYFQPKPKRLRVSIPLKDVSVLPVSLPLSFNVKVPLSAYQDPPVESIETLNNRLKECAVVPEGRHTAMRMCVINTFV